VMGSAAGCMAVSAAAVVLAAMGSQVEGCAAVAGAVALALAPQGKEAAGVLADLRASAEVVGAAAAAGAMARVVARRAVSRAQLGQCPMCQVARLASSPLPVSAMAPVMSCGAVMAAVVAALSQTRTIAQACASSLGTSKRWPE
jgi:hypothetical protein